MTGFYLFFGLHNNNQNTKVLTEKIGVEIGHISLLKQLFQPQVDPVNFSRKLFEFAMQRFFSDNVDMINLDRFPETLTLLFLYGKRAKISIPYVPGKISTPVSSVCTPGTFLQFMAVKVLSFSVDTHKKLNQTEIRFGTNNFFVRNN